MAEPFWAEIARRWSLIGPPIRPAASDVARMAGCLPLARSPLRRLLVLGATPEYPALAARVGATAFAVDLSADMLRAIWPGPGPCARGNWLRLPWADQSFDALLGDGIFTLLGFPGDCAELAREVRRVLRPGGVFGVRVFCDGHRGEGPQAVHALLAADRIASFHELRFRLLMALQRDPAEGVACRALWEYWQRERPELSQRFGTPGWSRESEAIIDSYQHATDRFRFPSEDEVRDVLAKELHEVGCFRGDQGFEALWPTLAFRRER